MEVDSPSSQKKVVEIMKVVSKCVGAWVVLSPFQWAAPVNKFS